MVKKLLENLKEKIYFIKEELKNNTILFTLKSILLLIAFFYFTIFLYITVSRINYPFALEWMEGTSLVQVHRILSGQLLYVEPSLNYIPLIYPPLYYYVAALFAKVIGIGFFPLRLVSLLSTFGCMAHIFLIVRKIQPNIFAQIVAVGLFSAMFKIGGAWFDIARVDMLALFLALASIYQLQFLKKRRFFLSGILFTLSCMTKQTYLILLIATWVYCFFLDRKKAWVFIASSMSLYSIVFFILNIIHGGWYRYFIFDLPQNHTAAFDFTTAGRLFFYLIFRPICLIFLFTVFHFIQIIGNKKNYSQMNIILIVGSIITTSWLGIINPGGFNNVVVPSHAILSIIAGIFLSKMLSKNFSPRILQLGILILTVIQFVLLRYPIRSQIPTAEDLRSGNMILQKIKQTDGDVYVPYHPELMLLAGKKNYAGWISMAELEGKFEIGTRSKEWTKVKSQLQIAFRKNKFAMIIIDNSVYGFYGHPEYYYPQTTKIVYFEEDTFYPVTGWNIRPSIIYTR